MLPHGAESSAGESVDRVSQLVLLVGSLRLLNAAVWYQHSPDLGCVHSLDTSTSPGFGLQLIEASLVRVERLQSPVQAHNSTLVGHIENLQ